MFIFLMRLKFDNACDAMRKKIIRLTIFHNRIGSRNLYLVPEGSVSGEGCLAC